MHNHQGAGLGEGTRMAGWAGGTDCSWHCSQGRVLMYRSSSLPWLFNQLLLTVTTAATARYTVHREKFNRLQTDYPDADLISRPTFQCDDSVASTRFYIHHSASRRIRCGGLSGCIVPHHHAPTVAVASQLQSYGLFKPNWRTMTTP